MSSEEIKEAVRKERFEIAELVSSFGFPWWSFEESEAAMAPLVDAIRRRDCKERGHTRGIPTNQITGRELCQHCHDEIHIEPCREPAC
ncbi:MAG: hypothetical protein A2428_02970 [Bdellovibrionales bacterium RIFOXYC1_FULL_54_43]|nr:MAG: hypothetical protein A2428_02970 [Bdellovibrionales bacterium RIFOXYC1_FULL_54_43]OFZ82643.1 MAG: hypothetical protein A2603_02405 [Bdellovibrionales bacterium RIFOXYD1_FULL_55_31]